MESLLVRLMLIAALLQFGMTLEEFSNCRGRACVQKMDRRVRDVLRVDWKPISVWPEEGKRFRASSDTRSFVEAGLTSGKP